jgi:hypothetical protein
MRRDIDVSVSVSVTLGVYTEERTVLLQTILYQSGLRCVHLY